MTDTAEKVWRGNPVSADHKPDPREIVDYLNALTILAENGGTLTASEVASLLSGKANVGDLGALATKNVVNRVDMQTLDEGRLLGRLDGTGAGVPVPVNEANVREMLGLKESNAFAATVDRRISLVFADPVDDLVFVRGHSLPGDGGDAAYVRGGTVYPTNGFGLSPSSRNAEALGITNDIGVEPDVQLTRDRTADELFGERVVTISADGFYQMLSTDYDIPHDVVLSGTNVVFMDAQHLPVSRSFEVNVRGSGTGHVVIDVGPTAFWSGFANRYIVLETNNSIKFTRTATGSYSITGGFVGGTPPRAPLAGDNVVPFVRAGAGITAGQSLMAEGMGRGSAHGSFCEQLAAIGGPATCWINNVAVSGAGVSNLDGSGTNYWVDMTDPANPADGPNLIAAAALIASNGGDASQPAPEFIIWDQGQRTVSALKTNAITIEEYKTATAYAIARLRTLAGVVIPALIKPIGKVSVFPDEVSQIRAAQYEIAANLVDARIGFDTWDLELKDSVHPSNDGYSIMGKRDAQLIGEMAYSIAAGFDQPTFELYAYSGSDNTLELRFLDGGTNDACNRVADPAHVRVFDSNGDELEVVKAAWVSAVPSERLRVFVDGNLLGGTVHHAYDAVLEFDQNRVIRSSVSGLPVRSQSFDIPAA